MSKLSNRAIIRISATDATDDPRSFLQGLVTQDMTLVQTSAPQWGALLSPQGKCLFDFIAHADGQDILIDCESRAAESLSRKLMMYRLRRKIEIKIEDDLYVHWSMENGDKPHDPRLNALGHRWVSAQDSASCDEAFRKHRISYGVCEGVDELGSDKILWLECNAIELNGVSFTKGCYIGQENTARMNYRNKVNRRIMCVPIAAANPKRQIFAYDDISIEHRKIDDLDDALVPDWMAAALAISQA